MPTISSWPSSASAITTRTLLVPMSKPAMGEFCLAIVLPLVFHFPFSILHLSVVIVGTVRRTAMTDDKCDMENGKWNFLKIFACLLIHLTPRPDAWGR